MGARPNSHALVRDLRTLREDAERHREAETVLLEDAERHREPETEASRYLTAIVESSDDAIIGKDLDGRILSWNAAAERLYGYSSEEAIGRSIEMLLPADRFDEFWDILERVKNDEPVDHLETVRVRKDGSTIPVSLSVSPIKSPDGRVVAASAIGRDISKQRHAEAALSRAGRYFDLSHDLVCTAGFDGVFREVGKQWTALLGWSREELCSRPFVEFVHPEDQTATTHEASKLADGDVTVAFINRYRTSDGGWRWLDWTARAIPEEGLIYASARDVTDRKAMEDQLQNANAALERSAREREVTLESIGEGILTVDREGWITFANPVAEALLGWSHGQLIGRPQHETVHHTRADGSAYAIEECPVYAVLQTGEVARRDDEVYWRKDGASFPVEYVSAPLRDQSGEIVGAVLAFKDIAERKHAEAELEAARDEALAATQLKSEFLANMSHEIRTPMNGVIGMSELLLDTDLTPEQHQFAEIVHSSGGTLLSIINDILDFSKIEAGKLELDLTRFPLEEVVEDVVDLLADRAHKKGLELTALVETDVPKVVRGDEGRLRQILMNLVSNGIKFTEEEEVHVRVSVEETADAGATIRHEVKDTGIGITPDASGRLFETFAQADTSTTRRFGGTGLGLTISKQLVEMMGGRIAATGTPGEGSTFWFSVPLELANHDFSRDEEVAGSEALRGQRLLIVDDNAASRQVVAHHASAWGMEMQEAVDGPSALTILRAATREGRPFDLVALDMHMPGMSGLDVARLVRTDKGIGRTKVALLSSAAERPEDLAAAGMDAYAAKPVRRARLRRTLLQLVGDVSAPAPDSEAKGKGIEEARALRRRMTVLVAEDNVVNQAVAERMLEKLGYSVDLARDGREAVDAVARRAYDAVLMDCQMPELDGYGATAEIRGAEGSGGRLPIIAMTAHTMEGDRERCLASGMDDYISKPVLQGQLEEVLERAVPAAARGPGGAPAPEQLEPENKMAVQHPVLDESSLDAICGDDDDLRHTLVETFLDQTGAGVAELRTAFGLGDGEVVARCAHKLKGSAATLGAPRMAALCEGMCQLAREGDLSEGLNLQEEFEEVVAATETALLEHAGHG